MSVRISFVEHFGEEQAQKIEAAAYEHENEVHAKRGSDPFKWAILIVIGYQCAEKEGYREYHGITIAFEDFKAWCKDHGELGSHDGDCDYLAMFAGAYNEYMPEESR